MNKRGLGLRGGLVIAIVVLLVAIVGVIVYYGVSSSDDDSNIDLDNFRRDTTDNNFAYCGDGSCNGGESSSSCPSDCGSGSNNNNNNNQNNNQQSSLGVEIEVPEDGDVYGYSDDIELEFTITDNTGILESCWYQVDDEDEVDIDDCEEGESSINFDVNGTGDHEVTLYARDTNNKVKSDSVDFEVNIGAPTINVISPADLSYSNDNPQAFVYKPQDANLDRCELWSNFAGTFRLNQTDSDPESGQDNTFNVPHLGVGQYIWSITCRDTENKVSAAANRTLTMDFTNPTLSWRDLIYDSGIQKVKAKITIGDANPTECSADYFGGGNVRGTGQYAPCTGNAEIDIDLPQNGVYEITINGRDYAGNLVSIKKNITINLACTFTGAGWSVTIADKGDNVELLINGTVGNECNGKEVEFSIFKENGANDQLLAVKKADFVGRTVKTNWKVGENLGGIGGDFIIPLIIHASVALILIGGNRRGLVSNRTLSFIFIVLAVVFVATLALTPGDTVSLQPAPVDQYYYNAKLVETPTVQIQSTYLSTPGCGNNVREQGEVCDGTDFGSSSNSCFNYNGTQYSNGNLTCASSCNSFGTGLCVAAVCGDNIKNDNEQCDDGNGNNGDGCSATCTDEYIRNAGDFERIRSDLDGSFVLANDIDLQGVDFEPIGSANNPFTGIINGDGHKITGLNIDANGDSDIGFIAVISGGNIENLHLETASIVNGENNIGILAGRMASGNVNDVHVSGSAVGDDSVGGVVGSMDGGIIQDSSSTATVSARISGGGGFVGRMGGDSEIIHSFASSAVSGQGDRIGGFVGNMRGTSRIVESYAHGSVSANDRVGGFAGNMGESAIIRISYSKGAVSGTTNVGGFIGATSGNGFAVTNSFWDRGTSNQQNSAGGNGIQGKTTQEMKQQATYPDPPWDFDDTWFINNGQSYPFFQWE